MKFLFRTDLLLFIWKSLFEVYGGGYVPALRKLYNLYNKNEVDNEERSHRYNINRDIDKNILNVKCVAVRW